MNEIPPSGRYQFSTSTLLSALTFVCVALGGVIAAFEFVIGTSGAEPAEYAAFVAAGAPIWIPFLFLFYAMGRRTFNVWILFAFAAFEVTSLGALYWVTEFLL
jgi:hypothetical protein